MTKWLNQSMWLPDQRKQLTSNLSIYLLVSWCIHPRPFIIHQRASLHWLHQPHPLKQIQKGFPAFMTLQIHIKSLCVLSHYNLYSGRVYKLGNTDYTPPNLHRIHDSLVLRLHFSHSQEKWVWWTAHSSVAGMLAHAWFSSNLMLDVIKDCISHSMPMTFQQHQYLAALCRLGQSIFKKKQE